MAQASGSVGRTVLTPCFAEEHSSSSDPEGDVEDEQPDLSRIKTMDPYDGDAPYVQPILGRVKTLDPYEDFEDCGRAPSVSSCSRPPTVDALPPMNGGRTMPELIDMATAMAAGSCGATVPAGMPGMQPQQWPANGIIMQPTMNGQMPTGSMPVQMMVVSGGQLPMQGQMFPAQNNGQHMPGGTVQMMPMMVQQMNNQPQSPPQPMTAPMNAPMNAPMTSMGMVPGMVNGTNPNGMPHMMQAPGHGLVPIAKSAPGHGPAAAQAAPPQTITCDLEDGICVVRWTVDARKLKGNDKTIVSPPFDVPLKATGTFKMMINPTPTKLKGGATFRNANGHGSVQLKCDTASDSQLAIRLSIGTPPNQEPARGPVEHNFAMNGVCGLPKDLAEWDFTKVVDEVSKTFVVSLELL